MSSTTPAPRKKPTFAAGLVLFFGVVGVAWLSAMMLPERAVLFAMPIIMLAATTFAVLVTRVDPRETLLLRLPTPTDLIMAIPLAISFFVIDDQIAAISHARFPVSEEIQEYFRRLLTVETSWDWVEKIGLIGVGAAVSEELMFRGFIQTAFLQRLRRPAAILFAALLFMLLHVQYLPVLAAGIILGFVTLATGSIVIPMFVHFANNFIQILLLNLAGLETLGDPVWIPPSILIPAVAMFALTWGYYMRRLDPEPESEPSSGSESDDRQARERITIPDKTESILEDLSSVPAARRRLGWLVVAGAVFAGVAVLTALFAWSIYFIYPERVLDRGIEVLETRITATLEPSAREKEPQIESAFQALSVLNESGQLELRDLAGVMRHHLELSADGGLDANDAEALVEGIRRVVMDRTKPRAL